MYLFVYFLALLGLSFSAWASHCGGFPCRAQTIGTRTSVVAAHRLNSCGLWAQQLRLAGSKALLSSCGTWA